LGASFCNCNLLPAVGSGERLLTPLGWLSRPTPGPANGQMAESSDLGVAFDPHWCWV